jgi:hypothetical protein
MELPTGGGLGTIAEGAHGLYRAETFDVVRKDLRRAQAAKREIKSGFAPI